MKCEFSLILTGDVSDQQADELHDAGCDDGSILTRGETTMVQFDREAASLDKALTSAIRNVEQAGLQVARVEIQRKEIPQTA